MSYFPIIYEKKVTWRNMAWCHGGRAREKSNMVRDTSGCSPNFIHYNEREITTSHVHSSGATCLKPILIFTSLAPTDCISQAIQIQLSCSFCQPLLKVRHDLTTRLVTDKPNS